MAKRPIRYIQKPKTTQTNNAAVVQNANVAPVAPPTREDEAKAREAYMQKAVDLFKSKSDKYALQRQAEKNIANQKSYENSRTPEQKASDAADIRAGNQRILINNNPVTRSTLPRYRKQIWESAQMTESDFQKQSLNAKNLERAKKGLPPLTESYSKSKDTRSGLAYNETDPFQRQWQQSQQYRDFQSAKGPINPTGEIQRVDKYGKPLGSVLWKNGQFVGTTKEDIIKASQDPSFERAANFAAQNAKAQVSANKNREIQDFNKRVAMQGLSSKAMQAMSENVKRSAESKANAQNLEIEQAARDQIREARDNFIKEQEKIIGKRKTVSPIEKIKEQQQQDRADMIKQKMESTGLTALEAGKLVDRDLKKVGSEPDAQSAFVTFNKLMGTGQIQNGQELSSALRLPGIDGNVKKAKGVLEAAGFDDNSIDQMARDYQINNLGIDPAIVNEEEGMAKIKRGLDNIKSGQADIISTGAILKQVESKSGGAGLISAAHDILNSDAPKEIKDLAQARLDDAEAAGLIKKRKTSNKIGKTLSDGAIVGEGGIASGGNSISDTGATSDVPISVQNWGFAVLDGRANISNVKGVSRTAVNDFVQAQTAAGYKPKNPVLTEDQQKRSSTLQKNYLAAAKSTGVQDVANGLSVVETLYSNDNMNKATGFDDVTVINAFQRMVDPGATVREGDVNLLASTVPWLQRADPSFKWKQFKSGDVLPPETRKSLKRVAQDIYDSRVKVFNSGVGKTFKSQAEESGIPFHMVGQNYQTTKDREKTQKQLSKSISESPSSGNMLQNIIAKPIGDRSPKERLYVYVQSDPNIKQVFDKMTLDQKAQYFENGFKKGVDINSFK